MQCNVTPYTLGLTQQL